MFLENSNFLKMKQNVIADIWLKMIFSFLIKISFLKESLTIKTNNKQKGNISRLESLRNGRQ
jgi:hypothetical protein